MGPLPPRGSMPMQYSPPPMHQISVHQPSLSLPLQLGATHQMPLPRHPQIFSYPSQQPAWTEGMEEGKYGGDSDNGNAN